MKHMKKYLLLLLACCLVTGVGCGNDKSADSSVKTESTVQSETTDEIDVDLTALSSTMVYSEVYNMMNTPRDYIGKKVKMKGTFSVYDEPTTGARYFSCIISDATACCSQGMEFELEGEKIYPADYPSMGSDITVTGVYETYYEGDTLYCRLANAKLS